MKTNRRTRTALWAVVLLALAGVWLAAGNAHVLHAAEGRLYERADAVPSRSVAIVLGARVWPGGRPSPVLEDRLQAAVELYRAGRVRSILVTGDNGQTHYNETDTMAEWLLRRGIPAADVYRDYAGFRTLDSMQRAARVFRVRDAVVCTQRFHLARSLFLAQRAGIDAVGFVADRREYVYARRDRFRETVARAWALIDTYVLRRGPKFLGPEIPIPQSHT